ncbi:MAG TPA: bifunctional glutamate N-acetyltransferase/amino-acid acetyltransferase ArgJ, partial [Candidatus Thermoplasmatota archaeon]|nr:bifunctional glutamate N-acetyltransferase/amino-acid acetyltransferase ArgJ [Candidatus Thermoplasmatota archaeon]
MTPQRNAQTVTTLVHKKTPLKILHDAELFHVKGYQASGFHAGLKKRRRDITLIYTKHAATCAGVFTQNAVVAAPVMISRETVKAGTAQAVVVNSGCANACTGEQGLKDARTMQEITAGFLKIKPEHVLVASTGVIGQLLPMDKVHAGIKAAYELLAENEPGAAAEGIMTTDTVPKQIVIEVPVGNKSFRLGGIAKGSGMIAPNMATMLGFLVTDAAIDATTLQKSLKESVDETFNNVSVDHDTSTNDMVVVLANGAAGLTVGKEIPLAVFKQALDYVNMHLAKTIARDGEGATKLILSHVTGALNKKDARQAAKAIINSPLVKSAVHGADPNWGRILCAVGYSGAKVELEQIVLRVGNAAEQIELLSKGEPVAFNREQASILLRGDEVHIFVDLGLGTQTATAYGCDLSREYVDINAHYTT